MKRKEKEEKRGRNRDQNAKTERDAFTRASLAHRYRWDSVLSSACEPRQTGRMGHVDCGFVWDADADAGCVGRRLLTLVCLRTLLLWPLVPCLTPPLLCVFFPRFRVPCFARKNPMICCPFSSSRATNGKETKHKHRMTCVVLPTD